MINQTKMYTSLLPTLPYFNCDKMAAKKHPKKKAKIKSNRREQSVQTQDELS